MRHTIMALFPAFAEGETQKVENSSKGGKYFLYETVFSAEMIIYARRISIEPVQVLAISEDCLPVVDGRGKKCFLRSAKLPETFLIISP